MRAVLGLLALAVVAAPFAAVRQYEAHRRAVADQAPAPGGGDARPRGSGGGPPAAPVVLAYHDVAPDAGGRYTVTPRSLDAQLSALRAAGYRTLSTAEFTAYLRTGRPPARRSVYLTFDDGTRGLWVHADPILAKYRMKAAAYLITGLVGTHRPYYLSWQETARMAGSGRWDFQAHTRHSHRRAPVDASGRTGSVLANRLWLPARGRLETEDEYRRRIEADLDGSARDLADHGLPAARLFAYPFSETAQRTNLAGRDVSLLQRLLRARFAAALTNTAPRPLPAGPRAAAAGQAQRLEVLSSTTPARLLRQVSEWTSVTPGQVREPLRRPGRWQASDGTPEAVLAALTGRGPHAARTGCLTARYRPVATADWTAYRVRATAAGLRSTSNSVSVTVRDGSSRPVTLTVGRNTARLTDRVTGTPAPGAAAGGAPRTRTGRLAPSAAHRLTLLVSPRRVRAVVDGRTVLALRTPPGSDPAEHSGGFALAARNATAGAWPRFTALDVAPPTPPTPPTD
ncbi:polysaccharide deacetylase family protein [Streptomyces sp. NPDC059785]|uniref:polysaccharide deacetylase family protein n=1 Tax=Streptomyces sp. NPDC059785 TaxID=3346945 RepID=UPI00366A2916